MDTSIEPKVKSAIAELEQVVLDDLSCLEKGYVKRKWAIAQKTGIPEEILTPILYSLKIAGKIELVSVFNEYNGMLDGSGYALKTANQ